MGDLHILGRGRINPGLEFWVGACPCQSACLLGAGHSGVLLLLICCHFRLQYSPLLNIPTEVKPAAH